MKKGKFIVLQCLQCGKEFHLQENEVDQYFKRNLKSINFQIVCNNCAEEMNKRDPSKNWVQLITPDGLPHLRVGMTFAIKFCMSHPGYDWKPTL